jgi:hypothetical protein
MVFPNLPVPFLSIPYTNDWPAMACLQSAFVHCFIGTQTCSFSYMSMDAFSYSRIESCDRNQLVLYKTGLHLCSKLRRKNEGHKDQNP